MPKKSPVIKSATKTVKKLSHKISTSAKLPKLPKLPELFRPIKKTAKKLKKIRLPKRRKKVTISDLINAESAIGRTLFGEIPEGHQREFFQHKKNVWIWHESWEDAEKTYKMTIRYEVREDGVYKRSMNSQYVKITGKELENFRAAAKAYLKLIKEKLY